MPQFSTASAEKLATCDNRLQVILNDAIQIVDFTVLQGHRGQEEQDKAFTEGKSQKKFPFGNHNAIPSRAADIAPLSVDTSKGKLDWGDNIAFGRLMGIVQAVAFKHGVRLRFGVDWDGDWRSVGRDNDEHFLDAPHVELLDP